MATQKKFVPAVEFHPGVTLKEKLEEMGMGVKEFAIRTSKPEKTIIAVIKGKSRVTPEMAVAFENVTKIPAHFWLNLQQGYDEYEARKKRNDQIAETIAWAKSFPLAQMSRLEWIPSVKTCEEKADALLGFFQVSSPKAWEDYYINRQLKVAFRISLSNAKDPHAMSAWLRRGEIQAQKISAGNFSEATLKETIPQMKQLCANQSDNFFNKLQELCLKAGVKLVYTPCLAQAPINGCTRWINGTPCIQMTNRYKRNDVFWFTFFHELGHILLHGKKDVFLECIGTSDDEKKEAEADAFSARILFSQAQEDEVVHSRDFSENAICGYAKRFGIHPAIIVGRLQHKKIIPYNKDKSLIKRIEFAD